MAPKKRGRTQEGVGSDLGKRGRARRKAIPLKKRKQPPELDDKPDRQNKKLRQASSRERSIEDDAFDADVQLEDTFDSDWYSLLYVDDDINDDDYCDGDYDFD